MPLLLSPTAYCRDNLAESDSNIARASRAIRTMANRNMTNKIVLVLVIFALIMTIVLIIYYKFFKKSPEAKTL